MMWNGFSKSTEAFYLLFRSVLRRKHLLHPSRRSIELSDLNAVAIPLQVCSDTSLQDLVSRLEDQIGNHIDFELCSIKTSLEVDFPCRSKGSPQSILRASVERLLQDVGYDAELICQLLREVPKHWERHGTLVVLGPGAFADIRWKTLGNT